MAVHAGAKPFWSSIDQPRRTNLSPSNFSDDPAPDYFTSGTTGNPKGALPPTACARPSAQCSRCVTTSCQARRSDVGRRPTGRWIGGLINALFAAWYHAVPIVGHRAGQFERRRAMQMMADHAVRNVLPAADRAES